MKKTDILKLSKLIRDDYRSYKVCDLAVSLYAHDIDEEDIAYIMQGGKDVPMTPYSELQAWLALAMDRMAERVPAEKAVAIRQGSACCLGGMRDKLAKEIFRNNPTTDARFEALAAERRIVGGKAWKEGDDYFVTYWYAKPEKGYTCGCLRHVPEAPMNKLWCECCAGHIKHHFETALGVKATCTCVTSVLVSCGNEACLFKLNIII